MWHHKISTDIPYSWLAYVTLLFDTTRLGSWYFCDLYLRPSHITLTEAILRCNKTKNPLCIRIMHLR